MDAKSAFLNGFIEEEVYVRQPPIFEHPKFPNRVFKLQKVLYDDRGVRDEDDGRTSVFIGHQIRQTPQGTFVHQSKYTRDLLQKFEMADASLHMTPMSTSTALDADEDGKKVDQKVYRGMIGSLLYLTATRPDIQFAVGLCAHFQAFSRESHRTAVKRILRYIKFTSEFGLWYSADSSLFLLGSSDSDHVGCRIDRKSTSGTYQFLGTSLVSWSSRKAVQCSHFHM
ncbi:hypothetical protein U9M48_041356 [Paspalum notatum var. saurae]|uniref:Reverse transcriptase Ty1/copia-type domain-containing protein n=1 Tax=Paspalum notatum var. saurae TaxID=547442 RepID=A0AAQ3XES1_PASNO